MRHFFVALFLVLGGISASVAGVPAYRHDFSDADKADLDRVSAALNAAHTMKGGFVQIDPDGQIDEGVFYIEKPGKMRFEYHAPDPILIVSDGSTVAVQNRKLDTVDHYPIWSTPLDLILSDDLNLKRNSAIAGISREPGELIVNARANSTRVNGNISLVFSDPALELLQWTVVDSQGGTTTVSVRDVQQNVTLDPELFTLPEKSTKTDE